MEEVNGTTRGLDNTIVSPGEEVIFDAAAAKPFTLSYVLQSGRIRLHCRQFVATRVEKVEASATGETEDRFGHCGANSGDSGKGRLQVFYLNNSHESNGPQLLWLSPIWYADFTG